MSFSIVIPTRAREEALARCLDQIQPQALENGDEIIVTDDGESDATRQMMASRFPGVKWTAGPRRGPAANRNHGAAQASGEFIVFIDDDVVPSSGLLAAYRAAITAGVNIYEGRTTCAAGLTSPMEAAPVNETGGWLWSCNMMLRASWWRTTGGFDELFPFPHMEDVAFRERSKAAGERILFAPDALVDHPPRRIPPARSRARVHESHFIYHYKYLGRRPSLIEFLGQFARYVGRHVLVRRKGRDTLTFLGSSGLELTYLLRRWHAWDVQYRDLAANPVLTSGGGTRPAKG